jgi:alkaline phosphatase D
LTNKHIPAPINYNPNPHLKFADLQNHGYLVLRISTEEAKAEFYFDDHLEKKSGRERLGAVLNTRSGENFLQRTT